jgi:hypothetical protein
VSKSPTLQKKSENPFRLALFTTTFSLHLVPMGIVDLWKIVHPGEKKYTLEQIANDRSVKKSGMGLRVAIDVALWTFQARASVVGE